MHSNGNWMNDDQRNAVTHGGMPTPAERGNVDELRTINAELLATCKELRDACAALCRAMVKHGVPLAVDVVDGFGARADAAIRKAEGK